MTVRARTARPASPPRAILRPGVRAPGVGGSAAPVSVSEIGTVSRANARSLADWNRASGRFFSTPRHDPGERAGNDDLEPRQIRRIFRQHGGS